MFCPRGGGSVRGFANSRKDAATEKRNRVRWNLTDTGPATTKDHEPVSGQHSRTRPARRALRALRATRAVADAAHLFDGHVRALRGPALVDRDDDGPGPDEHRRGRAVCRAVRPGKRRPG